MAGSANASLRPHLTVTPMRSHAGAKITVSASSSPCLAADTITLISAAFPGHAYGEGTLVGRVRAHGAFTVSGHLRKQLKPGRYTISGRCGGGNLGSSAVVTVIR